MRPLIDQGWSNLSARDMNTLQWAADFMRKFVNSSDWGKQHIRGELFPARRYPNFQSWAAYNLHSAYHQLGTCALGVCTDLNARVKGVQQLRVCDAALIPVQLDVNPTFTMYGMCEKVAALMLQ